MEMLLPELRDSESDLLPLGTKVFPSTYRIPDHLVAGGGSVILGTIVLLAIGGATGGSQGGTITGIAVAFFVVMGAALVWLVCNSRKTYRIKCASGTWTEGIFLFPSTGDVVIRMPTLFRLREVSFVKENVHSVEVREGFSWSRCGRAPVLVIHHISGEHELDAAKLVGSAQGIADRINQVQRGSSRNVYA
jgi:hypothetical protein